jgi:SNF2 family DNA or RNA helicase
MTVAAKTYGRIVFVRGLKSYVLALPPHIRGKVRRFFPWAKIDKDALIIPDTASNCEDLEMMLTRWPLFSPDDSDKRILQRAGEARARMQQCDLILSGKPSGTIKTLIPLRDYQMLAVDLLMHKSRLLCGDDLGLGKTVVALGAIAAGATPAIIVCQNHLLGQWRDEARKFLGPMVNIHLQRTGAERALPYHDILVIPYSLLSKWSERLHGYSLIVFDEAQELRREDSAKYKSAEYLAANCDRVLGLTATPVYNYGDEMFNLLNLIDPDCLGPRSEFLAEWCIPMGGKYRVKEPIAMGHHLAEQHLFLRRRRSDVGRELPPVSRIIQDVEYDEEIMKSISAETGQLARAILSSGSSFNEKGLSARKLDLLLRQKTGIAKAPFVARFVAELVESGEHVVLCGWHREVYEVWCAHFKAEEIPHYLYTGTESVKEKDKSVTEFLAGPPGVFIMSLRSGAGLNGLQTKSSLIVFGELDWSPKVHDQCVGRLNRDGQDEAVSAIFLVAAGGSDPVVARLLGLKREQSEGIINPDEAASDVFEDTAEVPRGAALAKQILESLKPERKSA